jgi:hypothetical protein
MKLIKQAKLFFQEGSSDKVYEVDLCYVGGDRYVVDFRYGRRGATLKSGSKTGAPVSLPQAEKVFNELVTSKLKEGYQYTGGAPAPTATATPGGASSFAKAVLTRLSKAKDRNQWPLKRAIWRAGELKLKEAVPLLLPLLTSGRDWMQDYCVLWAFGSIGDPSVTATVRQYADSTSYQPKVKRIAKYALLLLADEATKSQVIEGLTRSIPPQLASLLTSDSSAQLSGALRNYLAPNDPERYIVLERLYMINSEATRPALLEYLQEAPLVQNSFRPLRHLFKAAELRRDAEVFGLLAARFERGKAAARSYYQQNRSPFQKSTRDYLRRRQWHTLKHLGHLGDPDYVNLAVGSLLQYQDSDAHPPISDNAKGYQAEWEKFARYYAFNHILYGGGDRYQTPAQGSRDKIIPWFYRYPNNTEPTNRQESFPAVWDKRPEGLVHLLMESKCHPVHKFAARALQSHNKLCEQLDDETLIQLVSKPYEVTAQLAFRIIWTRIKPISPDLPLLAAIADSNYQQGRVAAQQLISQNAMLFLNESDFLAALCTSKHQDTRAFANKFFKSTTITGEAEEKIVTKLLAFALSTQQPEVAIIKSLSATLRECFAKKLQSLGREIVLDLLQHSSAEVQELGGNILLLQDRTDDEGELIHALLRSDFEVMRGIGIKLLGQLPDAVLLQQEGLLVSLCAHTLLHVRNMSRPIIKRLVAASPALAKRLAARFIELLQSKEPPSVHDHLISLLMDELSAVVPTLSGELALQLTRAKSVPTQEFGGYLLSTFPAWGDELDTKDIAKLASHELRIVREACFAIFTHIIPRLKKSQEELSYASKLLEATWQDSRELGFTLFEETFTQDELTPQILVGICDSPRNDVRAFGQKMITKYFEDAHGEEYLLKLSEHPSSDLQTFATNYLEQFAKDNPERLRGLSHYFTVILSRVNKGRLAKQRVMQFLAQEALKSEPNAIFVTEILNRASATVAIQDRARAIEVMLQLKRAYPNLPVLLSVQKPQEKTAQQAR